MTSVLKWSKQHGNMRTRLIFALATRKVKRFNSWRLAEEGLMTHMLTRDLWDRALYSSVGYNKGLALPRLKLECHPQWEKASWNGHRWHRSQRLTSSDNAWQRLTSRTSSDIAYHLTSPDIAWHHAHLLTFHDIVWHCLPSPDIIYHRSISSNIV